MFSCGGPGHCGMTEHIDLGDQSDPKIVGYSLDPGDFLLSHGTIRPAVPWSYVTTERTPGLDHGIVEFVICRQADQTLDFPGLRLMEPADVYSPEIHSRRILDRSFRHDPARDGLCPSFWNSDLTKRIESISHTLKTRRDHLNPIFTHLQPILLFSHPASLELGFNDLGSKLPVPLFKMLSHPLGRVFVGASDLNLRQRMIDRGGQLSLYRSRADRRSGEDRRRKENTTKK